MAFDIHQQVFDRDGSPYEKEEERVYAQTQHITASA